MYKVRESTLAESGLSKLGMVASGSTKKSKYFNYSTPIIAEFKAGKKKILYL